MSLEVNIKPVEVVKTLAKVAAAGFAFSLPGSLWVIINEHRRWTHRSIEVDSALEDPLDGYMKIYAPEPRIWAAVHDGHHKLRDVDLFSFLEISDAVEWMESRPDRDQKVPIPNEYSHLDRGVERFNLKGVKKIGGHARAILIDRMGGEYRPPSDYTDEKLRDILNPTSPRWSYDYDPIAANHKNEYTLREIARVILRDPHSPYLAGKQNGVREVMERNVPFYQVASHIYKKYPRFMPKHLRNEDDSISRDRNFGDYALGVGLPTLAVLIAKGVGSRGNLKTEDLIKTALYGGVIFGARLGFHIAGGNITNSLGHAGVMTSERFPKAILGKKYEFELNPNGSISTNVIYGGILGRLINFITFDEVGGQEEHHEHPEKIEYTSQKGLRAWVDAPWGMTLKTLAHSEHFPWIRPGRGFDLKEGEIRPDMPNPGVLLIEQRRIEPSNRVEQMHRRRVEQLKALQGN